jgi:hypothetical protein
MSSKQPSPPPYRKQIADIMETAKDIRELRVLLYQYAQTISDRKERLKLAGEMMSAVFDFGRK